LSAPRDHVPPAPVAASTEPVAPDPALFAPDVDLVALAGHARRAAERGSALYRAPSLAERVRRLPIAGGPPRPVELNPTEDKYALPPGPAIDCDARLPLCRAACCHLSFALSRQDLDEGVVRWSPREPYLIRRRADKSCVHLSALHCSIYAQRPAVCRKYDCRNDRRIWLDFDARIPAVKGW
jgi:Fe-S-cluster containining protein